MPVDEAIDHVNTARTLSLVRIFPTVKAKMWLSFLRPRFSPLGHLKKKVDLVKKGLSRVRFTFSQVTKESTYRLFLKRCLFLSSSRRQAACHWKCSLYRAYIFHQSINTYISTMYKTIAHLFSDNNKFNSRMINFMLNK